VKTVSMKTAFGTVVVISLFCNFVTKSYYSNYKRHCLHHNAI